MALSVRTSIRSFRVRGLAIYHTRGLLCAQRRGPLVSCIRAAGLVGLGGPGLLRVQFFLFLLCGFRLFSFPLPNPFGLVLLAFLVAHRVTPSWYSSLHFAARRLPVIYGLGHLPLFRVLPIIVWKTTLSPNGA